MVSNLPIALWFAKRPSFFGPWCCFGSTQISSRSGHAGIAKPRSGLAEDRVVDGYGVPQTRLLRSRNLMPNSSTSQGSELTKPI